MENILYLQSNVSITPLKRRHPLFGVKAALSPYAGCQGRCLFCPHALAGKIGVKTDFLYSLEKKLSRENPEGPLVLGASCEPYGDAERKFKLSRTTIELVMKHRLPLHILTRSTLILRDADLLREYSAQGLCAVSVSLFSLDESFANTFEPDIASPAERLALLAELKKGGVLAGMALSPILPYVTDTPEQLEAVFDGVRRAKGEYLLPSVMVVASRAVRARITDALEQYFPKIVHRFKNLYENSPLPALTYASRVDDLITALSRKYRVPPFLPTEGEDAAAGAAFAGIRQEMLP